MFTLVNTTVVNVTELAVHFCVFRSALCVLRKDAKQISFECANLRQLLVYAYVIFTGSLRHTTNLPTFYAEHSVITTRASEHIKITIESFWKNL